MAPILGRILIYTRHMPEMVAFYQTHFGYVAGQTPGDRIIELTAPDGLGVAILLHRAAKGQKQGTSAVKLVFDVENVELFCRQARDHGLEFGPIHHADGYVFANARDPSGTPISVSGRSFAVGPRKI